MISQDSFVLLIETFVIQRSEQNLPVLVTCKKRNSDSITLITFISESFRKHKSRNYISCVKLTAQFKFTPKLQTKEGMNKRERTTFIVYYQAYHVEYL